MKKTVLNGQVLSEKEMKEVKGGAEITLDGRFYYCPICGKEVSADEILKGVFYAKCGNCGALLSDID